MIKTNKTMLILGIASSMLFACNKNGGFDKTESGLQYKFHVENEDAAKPKEGDVLSIHLVYKVNDSILFDTRTINNGEPSPTILSKPTYKGDLVEGYALMHIGDSATFKVNADTFFYKMSGRPDLPPGIKPGSELCVDIKLYKIQSKKEYEQEQATMFEKLKVKENAAIAKYMTEKKLSATPTASGLFYIETKKGTGKQAEPNKTVSVHYKGSFMSGSVFDSSFDRKQPFEFTVGAGQVIPGWDEGLLLMKEGGKATLVIPWWIAYGPNGYGNAIPPFASLIFEVELISVK